ncbi:MAG TPA: hypothetical protein VH419_16350 [Nocardioidaceae bacterium]
MGTAFGSLWAVSDNGNRCLAGGPRKGYSLFRIDPEDGRVGDGIPLHTDLSLYVTEVVGGEGAVWVATWTEPGTGDGPRYPHGVLSRVDPVAGEVTGRLGLNVVEGHLAVGNGAVWVADTPRWGGAYILRKVDPSTMRIASRLRVGRRLGGVAVAFGSVWVAADGSVLRIDPSTNRVVATITAGPDVGGFVIWRGLVWAGVPSDKGRGLTLGIDPSTNRIVERERLLAFGSLAAFGSVWGTDDERELLWRTDRSDREPATQSPI